MADVILNIINRTFDFIREVVIFQKNIASDFYAQTIVWDVIRNLGPEGDFPFYYTFLMQIGSRNDFHIPTPLVNAQNGQLFELHSTSSGDRLVAVGSGTSSEEIQVLNTLNTRGIDVSLYKRGRVLATINLVAPQEMAAFEIKHTIWIGVSSQVVEGQPMDQAKMQAVKTEISMLGIARADIVITGSKDNYNFELQNVVRA